MQHPSPKLAAREARVRHGLASLACFYGAPLAGWGAWLIWRAFFRDTPPLRRSGDVVGLPDEVVYRLGSTLLFGFGAFVVVGGIVNLIGGWSYLRRKRGGWMMPACLFDGLGWLVVGTIFVLKAAYVVGLTAIGIGLLHCAGTRVFGQAAEPVRDDSLAAELTPSA